MFELLKYRLKKIFTVLLLVAIFIGTSTAGWTPDSRAALPSGNAITDGKALLRYALPIDNPPVRELQRSLEDISSQLRANKRWRAVANDLKKANRVLTQPAKLLAGVPGDRQQQAEAIITDLQNSIGSLQTAVDAKDKDQTRVERGKLLDKVGKLEELMVKEFPFEVSAEYSNLPQLKGRATIAMNTTKGNLTVVVDGYSAPVTAGNFVDLVEKEFYNGLEFTRSEESYVLQTGDPDGPKGKEVGYVDKKTGKYRAIPLEILVQGDKEPTYGITLEEAGRYTDMPVLPFSAFGALALARPERDVNGGSSQIFFFLFEPELTPAGRNLLDGRYAIFGYLTEGQSVLDELKAGDKILEAKVVQGIENLVKS